MDKLQLDERIIAVVPEIASGPGWGNRLIIVYAMNNQNKLRTICLQPSEQTSEMLLVFNLAVEANRILTSAAERLLKPAKTKGAANG